MMNAAHTKSASNRKQLAKMVLGFVAVFCAVDWLCARFAPSPVYGNTNAVLRKLDLLESHERTPDVLFLGSSYEEYGIDAATIESSVSNSLGREVRCLNMAAVASSLFTQYLLVRRIVEGQHRPSLVYLGVTPNTVDTGMSDWMSNGVRALGDTRDLSIAWTAGEDVFQEALAAATFQSYPYWHEWRIRARQVVLGAPRQPPAKYSTDRYGWTRWFGETKLRPANLAAGKRGASAGSQPEPANIDITNINGIALSKAIHLLRRAGVVVRLLEMPLSNNGLSITISRTHPSYRRFLDDVVTDTGVDFIRPPSQLLSDADFFDNVHLAPHGAQKLSHWLAMDVADALSSSARSSN